jgi:hypothetical protein
MSPIATFEPSTKSGEDQQARLAFALDRLTQQKTSQEK